MQESAVSDISGSPYLRFRKEVIERGKVVCWICFIKDGGVLSELNQRSGCCPVHDRNRWIPTLVWRRTSPISDSDTDWVNIRPRHANSGRTGPLTLCTRGPDCQGPRRCQHPHCTTEKDAWTLDRDGGDLFPCCFMSRLHATFFQLFGKLDLLPVGILSSCAESVAYHSPYSNARFYQIISLVI